MIKIFDGEDKVYSTNGNLVVNPTLAKVHKADNGDFYLDLETPLIENEKERAAETGTYITGTSFTIQNYDSTKLVELTELDGNTSQSGTPTPTSPQPINITTGRQVVSVINKNLAEWETTQDTSRYTYSNFTAQDISVEKTATGGSFYASFILHIPKAGTYYLKGNNSSNQQFYIYTDRLWGTLKESFSVSTKGDFTRGTTFNSAGDYVIGLYGSALGNYSVKNFMCTTISDTTYEEYKGQSYEINLGKNLYNANDTTYYSSCTYVSGINTNQYTVRATGTDLVINSQVSSGSNYNASAGTLIPCRYGETIYYDTGNSDFTKTIITQYNSSKVSLGFAGTNKSNGSYTPTNSACEYVSFRIGYGSATSGTEYTLAPIISKGTQPTTYAPYKTPIELCKINDYQDFIRKGTGKNINSSVLEVGSISNGENVGNYFTVRTQDYIEVKPNTNYAFSINGILNRVVVSLYDINKNYIPTEVSEGLVSTTGLFTTFANAYYIRYRAYNADKNLFQTGKIQLEEGNQATLFEPYGYKDKWYLYKTIGKVVLNGSEYWKRSTRPYYQTPISNIIINPSPSTIGQVVCNYFKATTPDKIWSDNENGITNQSDGQFIRLRIKDDTYTLETFKTWLSSNNLIVYYVLATPTTTEITDSELINQLNSIELLEGLNNVSVSSADLPSSITLYYNYLDGYKNITKYIDYLVPNNIIVANTPQGEQAFRITNVEKTRRKIKIKAYHVFYDSENLLIEDSYVVDKNCNDALDHLNNATSDLSPFTTISNINTIANYRCVRKSLYEAIQVVLERWGGHLVRDNWSIGIYDTIGQDNGVIIRYAKNLKEMTATYNWDDVVTKLLPVGKDGILLNELDPTASLYVESALKYDIPYTKTISFEQNSIVEDDYKDEFGEVIEEEYKQALIDDLFAQATEYINNNYLPKVNYTLSANVEKVSDVGDSIEVIDEKLGINIMTNIISYDYDCILNRYLNLEFGNFTPTLNGLIDTITNNTEKLIQEENSTLAITLGRELDEATSKIWSALGNSYVIYDGDKILVVDSLPKETATNVIMINNGGIGFSNTGITGTFSSAWTIDNVLNMENINVINLTADLVKGGTLKLGSNLNQNGKLEVYDEANNLIAELNKNGLKMYGVDGSYVLMNNQVGFAGYDRNNNPVYWVSKDEFHMKKSVVEEEITLVNKMRIIPITIRNGNTIVNDGIGFINVPN